MQIKWMYLKILLISIGVFAQAQSDYTKWLEEQQRQMNQFTEQQQKEIKHFMDVQDSSFAEFLKQEWQAFDVYKGLPPVHKPKPEFPPETQPQTVPEDVEKSSVQIEEISLSQVSIKTSESIQTILSGMTRDREQIEINFLNTHLKVNYDSMMAKIALGDTFDEKSISGFWASLASSDYKDLLNQVREIKREMQLNDWGTILLARQIADKLYPDSENDRKLMIWFILLKSGYDARVGYSDKNIYLLIASAQTLYNVPYFLSDNKKYYIMDSGRSSKGTERIYSYQGRYSDRSEEISLVLTELPVLKDTVETRRFMMENRGNQIVFHVGLNPSLIDFYSQYPLTEMPVYCEAPLSGVTNTTLLQQLKPVIGNKTEIEAVNMLLHFVQSAFEYKKDDEQFGYERPLFPDETLFYPYSDCEDRSVLFSGLVRSLLRLDVIVLDYPEHVATAVRFSTDLPGDFLEYKGRKYLICDPTYIHANAGQCMPHLKKVRAKIIALN